MRTFLLLALLLPVSAYAENGKLDGDKLRAAIADKTVYILSPLGEIPIRYSADGSMKATTELALMDGETTTSDRGRWWISSDKLCIKWENWMRGRQHCFSMQRAGGSTVKWRRDDGKIGTARLSS